MNNSPGMSPWLQNKLNELTSATAERAKLESGFTPKARSVYDNVLEKQYDSVLELIKGNVPFRYDDDTIAVKVDEGRYLAVERDGVEDACGDDEEFDSLLTQGEEITTDIVTKEEVSGGIHYVDYDIPKTADDPEPEKSREQQIPQQPPFGAYPPPPYGAYPPYGYYPYMMYGPGQAGGQMPGYPGMMPPQFQPQMATPPQQTPQAEAPKAEEYKPPKSEKPQKRREERRYMPPREERTERQEDFRYSEDAYHNESEEPLTREMAVYSKKHAVNNTEDFLRSLLELQIGVTNIEAEKRELKRRCDDIAEQYNKASADLTDKIKENDKERAELDKMKADLEVRTRSMDNEIAKAKRELSAGFAKEREALQGRIGDTKKRLDETMAALAEANKKAETANSHLEELKKQQTEAVDGLNKKHVAELADKTRLLEEVKKQNEELQNRLKEAEDRRIRAENDIKNQSDGANALRQKLNGKDNELSALRNENVNLKKQAGEVENLRKQLSDKDNIIKGLNEKVSNAEKVSGDKSKAENDLKEAQSRIKELTEKADSAEKNVKDLQKKLDEAKNAGNARLNDDIAKLKAENEKLTKSLEDANRQAFADTLTGVKNISSFDSDFSKMNFNTMTFGIVSINGTKLVNDSFGFEYGDGMIKDVAALLADKFNKNFVYRVMGDQFYVLSRKYNPDNMTGMLEEIANTLQSRDEYISYGVAFGGNAKNKDDLIAQARTSCLEMKQSMMPEDTAAGYTDDYDNTADGQYNGGYEEPQYNGTDENIYNDNGGGYADEGGYTDDEPAQYRDEQYDAQYGGGTVEANQEAVDANSVPLQMSEDELLNQMK